MSQADRIRQFVFDHYIAPARSSGLGEITVRAGDIHKRMGLQSAMPAVCSALGGSKFLSLTAVSLRHRAGPANGSNVYFTFDLNPQKVLSIRKARVKSPGGGRTKSAGKTIDLDNALVLVSCVKSKRDHAAPARDLYTSPLFTMSRDRVELANSDWFVLSALYGLVGPNQEIEPYEHTLNTLGVVARREWAAKVLEKLLPIAKSYRQVVIFAGQRYREFLVEPLKDLGLEVSIPMEGLRLGEQLSWLGSGPLDRPDRVRSKSLKKTVVTTEDANSSHLDDIERFYELLAKLSDRNGGPRVLSDLNEYSDWPRRGVYFFFEPTEFRADPAEGLRVVRVGTHGLTAGTKSTLIQRLRQHRGNATGDGNHRGSIFRLLIGQALLARNESLQCPSWGVKGDKGKAIRVLGIDRAVLDNAERPIEQAVSRHISSLPFICLDVDDEPGKESLRSVIERNSISLLSNFEADSIDPPSDSWLGHYSNRDLVRRSGLWNQRHVTEKYDPGFLNVFESLIPK